MKRQQSSLSIHLEEMNQKGLVKERRLKIYQDRYTNKTRPSKIMKENSTSKSVEDAPTIEEKKNNFGVK